VHLLPRPKVQKVWTTEQLKAIKEMLRSLQTYLNACRDEQSYIHRWT
jgi:hypothetical protein